MTLIGHWVAADAYGNVTGIIPDRSSLENDGTIEDTGAGGYPYWQTMYSACAGFEVVPLGIFTAGLVIPDHASYTVTDFTIFVTAEVSTHGPSEFAAMMGHNPGAGVQRKWAFGTTGNVDVATDGSRTAIHISDGVSFTTLYSSYWPKELIQRDTTIPGQAPATMAGMYGMACKRSGNTFSFFHKWGVFRQTTGHLMDQETGLDIQTLLPATPIGTATSAIVVGNVTADLRLGSANEVGAFGAEGNVSWGAFYDAALDDDTILSILDTAYPVCGITLSARRHSNAAWVDQIMMKV